MPARSAPMLLLLLLLLSACNSAVAQLNASARVCKSLYLTHLDYAEHRNATRLREQLRRLVDGCEYVHGDLVLQRIGTESMSGARLSGDIQQMETDFLDSIVEVTGRVVVDQVSLRRLHFRSLRVIRGYGFGAGDDGDSDGDNWALELNQCAYLEELLAPRLVAIVNAGVVYRNVMDKRLYCRLSSSVEWTTIFQSPTQRVKNQLLAVIDGNSSIAMSSVACSPSKMASCHRQCKVKPPKRPHCWSNGSDACQTDARCSVRRCDFCFRDASSGSEECCHPNCLGGCSSQLATACFSCRRVSYNGECLNQCPDGNDYDSGKTILVPNGKTMKRVGDICVKECPAPFVTDSQGRYCLAECPASQAAVEGKCESCTAAGEVCKICSSDKRAFSDAMAKEFVNCSLWSLPGKTFNVIGSSLSNDSIEALKAARIIYSNYIMFKETESLAPNLGFLRKLRHVTGNLVLQNLKATYLGLSSLRLAKNLILVNVQGLCKNWYPSKFLTGSPPYKFKSKDVTFDDGPVCSAATCDPQCADECWGPGPELCVKCKNVSVEGVCYASCDAAGQYTAKVASNGSVECRQCHRECAGGCSGPGPSRCAKCRHFSEDGVCVQKCSREMRADSDGVCYSVSALRLAMVAVGAVVLVLALLLVVLCGWLYYRKRMRKYDMIDPDEYLSDPKNPNDMVQLIVVNDDDVVKLKEIGSGAFGTVYKGLLRSETNRGLKELPVAVKVLRGKNPKLGQELLSEAGVLARVKHPRCIRLVALCMTREVQLITALMPRGSLLDFLKARKNRIGAARMLNWALQVAQGMSYLESLNIVHRDLAARNVLLQTPDDIKITDFGLAKLLDVSEQEFMNTSGMLPVKWLGIECFESGVFSHKSDVWSYGVLLWEICSYGESPYKPYRIASVEDITDILRKGIRLRQPENCSVDLYNVMLSCWLPSPESRPGFKDLESTMEDCLLSPAKYIAAGQATDDDDDDIDGVVMRPRGAEPGGYAPMSEVEPDEKVTLVVRGRHNSYVSEPSAFRRADSPVRRRRQEKAADVADVPAPLAEPDVYLEPIASASPPAGDADSEYLAPRSVVTSAPVELDDDYLAPTKC